jgi:hypothetical protein
MWQLVKHTYGTEFVKFLDAQIATTSEHQQRSIQKQWRALVAANPGSAVSGASTHREGGNAA